MRTFFILYLCFMTVVQLVLGTRELALLHCGLFLLFIGLDIFFPKRD